MSHNLSAIFYSQSSHLEQARRLAQRFAVPLLSSLDSLAPNSLALHLADQGLQLESTGAGGLSTRVDFVGGKLGYRRAHQGAKTDLAKAVGIQAGIRPKVWDLTAGLGQDAFILASQGCEVSMFERHPVVYALLEDGLQRAQAWPDEELGAIIGRMTLSAADSLETLRETAGKPEVLYLDPMFPERSKTALVNKNMQLFHRLVGMDDDGEDLFAAAMGMDVNRVVVKRPRLAPPLGGTKAPLVFTGKAMRFDVYPFKKLSRSSQL